MCYDVDAKNKILKFFTVDPHNPKELFYYSVPYDVAILAYGSEPLTFGIEGVEKYSFFLREIHEARGIRRKLIRNILMAQSPGLSEATRFLSG
jgi:NADH dehydrogenase FAD-containing subunit